MPAPLLFSLFLALFSPSLAPPSLAESSAGDDWFEVEMVVYKHYNPDISESVVVHRNLKYPDRLTRFYEPKPQEEDPTSAASPPATEEPSEAAPHPYQRLDKARGPMREQVEKMKASNRFAILFHERWIQPAAAQDKADYLIIHGGRRHGDYAELQGAVQLSLSRFLHLDADLWLTGYTAGKRPSEQPLPPLPPRPEEEARIEQLFNTNIEIFRRKAASVLANIAEEETQRPGSRNFTALQTHRLKEKRRMRSGELHYLDHPKFAVLVKVVPYKRAAKEDAKETEPPQNTATQ